MDNGVKRDRVVETLAKTQGLSADTAIVIQGKDENGNEDGDDGEEVEEEDDDGRLGTIYSPPSGDISACWK